MTTILPGLVDRKTARRRAPTGHDLVVDIFAGAGGAGLGIEAALGRAVDIGINHDAMALRLYRINHPATELYHEDIWQVDPVAASRGRRVGLAWFSPDCTHFSKAKGGKPRDKRIRALAWVVIKWAKAVRPGVIVLENVEEFKTWGPLDREGRVIKSLAGKTFRAWRTCLTELGYAVEHRELVAADYGVPTTRKRFFLIARCDGRPIVWPKPTHAPRAKAADLGLAPWRAAAECIDWSLPCPSIFERRRPLAEATLRRIAKGLVKYVIEAEEPFIVTCNHGGPEFRGQSCTNPMCTLTASRDAHGVVVPYLSKYHGPRPGEVDGRCADPRGPLKTQDTENRFAVVSPTLIQTGYGERHGQSPRVPGLDKPLGTVVSGGCKHALVEAFLNKYRGQSPGTDAKEPVPTITSGHGAKRPAGAAHALGVTAVHLSRHFGNSVGRDMGEPAGAVTQRNHDSVVTSHLTKLYGTCRHGQDAREPAPTITGQGQHIAEVRAFLVKYYSTGGQLADCRSPMHTLTQRARMGLVTVAGQDYQIADIGLRMLQPAELLRAQFGRFAGEYVLFGTKAQQVAAIGNSVPPELAEAIVRANMRRQH